LHGGNQTLERGLLIKVILIAGEDHVNRVIFLVGKARCDQLLNIVAESVVADGEWCSALTVVTLELFQLVESDQDSFVDLDAKHVFAFFGRVMNHMIIDESHVLAKYREDEREVGLLLQHILGEALG
jgi:hypothetical protein